ncbi:hypothetical protein IFM89_029988 [Coptis chinensis]|uniref:Uncharacterized protein n=1 Tax=Coptis chinensis TaxID=261450 RepID=A0A835IHH2_9MAGN|nr:hypothetical protein IFM89_029988 [Coptis chinensis]
MEEPEVEVGGATPKRRTIKKFAFRGVGLDQLLDMGTDELVKLFTACARRMFQRGLKRKPIALIKKVRMALVACTQLPMYGELKLCFIVYLWSPKTKAIALDWAMFSWYYCVANGQSTFYRILEYLAAQSSRNGKKPNTGNRSTESLEASEYSAIPYGVVFDCFCETALTVNRIRDPAVSFRAHYISPKGRTFHSLIQACLHLTTTKESDWNIPEKKGALADAHSPLADAHSLMVVEHGYNPEAVMELCCGGELSASDLKVWGPKAVTSLIAMGWKYCCSIEQG